VLDLDAISQRPASLRPEQFADVLWAALNEDHADIRAGCPRNDAAAAMLVIWERYCRTVRVAYPFDQQPEAIRALMREL
jgi:hypothetical protein